MRREFFMSTKKESIVTLVKRLVPDAEQRAKVFDEITRKEDEGYSFHNAPASLELLIARILDGRKLPFEVREYHVSARGTREMDVCEATVKVIVRGALFHKVCEGNGPVSALDGALRLALNSSFPQLNDVTLSDFSVELIGTTAGADSVTLVSVVSSQRERRWSTIGVSRNLIKASLLALADGLEYALIKAK